MYFEHFGAHFWLGGWIAVLNMPFCYLYAITERWCPSDVNWSYLHQLSYHKSAIIPMETPYHLCWLNHHVPMVFPWISDISGGHHLVWHTHKLAQTPMPCLPACRDRPPWLAKSKEVRVEKAGKWIIAKGRVMGITIIITQELLDYNLYIQMFKWDLQYMADISP